MQRTYTNIWNIRYMKEYGNWKYPVWNTHAGKIDICNIVIKCILCVWVSFMPPRMNMYIMRIIPAVSLHRIPNTLPFQSWRMVRWSRGTHFVCIDHSPGSIKHIMWADLRNPRCKMFHTLSTFVLNLHSGFKLYFTYFDGEFLLLFGHELTISVLAVDSFSHDRSPLMTKWS